LLLWALILAYISTVGMLYFLLDSASRLGSRTAGVIAVGLVLTNAEFMAGSASGVGGFGWCDMLGRPHPTDESLIPSYNIIFT